VARFFAFVRMQAARDVGGAVERHPKTLIIK
jgi:hypothetical protein